MAGALGTGSRVVLPESSKPSRTSLWRGCIRPCSPQQLRSSSSLDKFKASFIIICNIECNVIQIVQAFSERLLVKNLSKNGTSHWQYVIYL